MIDWIIAGGIPVLLILLFLLFHSGSNRKRTSTMRPKVQQVSTAAPPEYVPPVEVEKAPELPVVPVVTYEKKAKEEYSEPWRYRGPSIKNLFGIAFGLVIFFAIIMPALRMVTDTAVSVQTNATGTGIDSQMGNLIATTLPLFITIGLVTTVVYIAFKMY